MKNFRYNPLTGQFIPEQIQNEKHTIEYDATMNAYCIRLDESVQLTNPRTVAIVDDDNGIPFVEQTARQMPNQNQFWVDYEATGFFGSGVIIFNPADNNKNVSVNYMGLGSVVSIKNVKNLAYDSAVLSAHAGGTANAITVSTSIPIHDAMLLSVLINDDNTDRHVTIDYNSSGPKPILKLGDSLLKKGDLVAGSYARLQYDQIAGVWQLANPTTQNRVIDISASISSNVLTATSIVDKLRLGHGDVIQIDNSTESGNNKKFTAINIIDSNNIELNRTTVDVTETLTITHIAIASEAAVGIGQEWVDTTSVRSINNTYTNNTGRAITVSLSHGAPAGGFVFYLVDGVVVAQVGMNVSGHITHVSFIVPAGKSWGSTNAILGQTIETCAELK